MTRGRSSVTAPVSARRHRRRAARTTALLLAALPAVAARAGTATWDPAVPTGLWSDPASWLGALPPAANDDVYLDSAGPADVDATYDLTTSPLYRDVYLQYGPTATGRFTLRLDDPARTFAATGFHVGHRGDARVLHTAGRADVWGDLTVGAGGAASYELANGTLATQGHLTVGGGVGTGTFLQAGGTNTVSGELRLSSSPATSAAYTLSGGRLAVSQAIVLAAGSNTLFTQTGGAVTAPQIVFGRTYDARGTYELAGGTLSIPAALEIGHAGTGYFVHSGGTLTAQAGILLGVRSDAAGVITFTNQARVAPLPLMVVGATGLGIVDHNTGAVTITPAPGVAAGLVLGRSAPYASGVYQLRDAATLTVNGAVHVGGFGSAAFYHYGGVHNVSTTLYLGKETGSSGEYFLSGGTLNANLDVGTLGTGNFALTGGSVVSGTVAVGDRGLFTQNAGSFRANALTLGKFDLGRYRLTGGAATVGEVRARSPWNTNGASIDQTGGSLTVTNYLFLGDDGAADLPNTAVYRLTGGQLRVNKQAYVGFSTAGHLRQDGGAVTVDDLLIVGTYRNWGTGQSKYTLNAGTLDARVLFIAYTNNAHGTFVQTGGTFTSDQIEFARGTGRYTLSGGTATTTGFLANFYAGTSVVDHTGGTLNVGSNGAALGYATNTTSTYNLSGDAALTVRGGFTVATRGKATFNQNGGSVTITDTDGDLILSDALGGRGTYNLTAGTLSIANNAFVGSTDDGTFNQSGGTFTAAKQLFIGNATHANGFYNMSGGTLDVEQIDLGLFGAGTFNQTNGAVVAGRLNVATLMNPARGTYNLRDGTLDTAEVVLGFSGSGTFNQYGGAATASTRFIVGNQGTQTSFLNVAGGTLDTPSLSLGQRETARGSLTLSGGTVTVSADLLVGYTEAGQGTVTVSAGKLAANRIFVGYTNAARGTFVQSGGTVLAATTALGSNSPDAAGQYDLTGGALANNSAYVGQYGRGVFNHSGGAHNLHSILAFDGLFIGRLASAYGTYAISNAATLYNNVDTFVGNSGRGEFYQSGGSASSHLLVVGRFTGASGTVTLSGGSLTARSREFVGTGGTGYLLQTGGTHTVGVSLSVGSNTAGSGGTFLLQGGSLTVPAIDVHPTGAFHHSAGTLNATSLTLRGGTVTLGGTQNWAPDATLTATGGTLTLNSDPGGPDGAARLALDLADTTTTFNADQHLRALRITSGAATLTGARVLVTQALQLEGAATLDLDRGALIVSHDDNPSPLAALRAALRSGYAAGRWDGPGLISSAAADDPSLAVGYAPAADVLSYTTAGPTTFLGQVAPPTSVLVRLTLAGDATLDGLVDFNDLVKLAQNYNAAGDWAQGDFTYDGLIDFNDLVKLAQSYNAALPPEPPPAGGAGAAFATDLAAAFAAVPEPGALSLLAAATALCAARRRRR